MYTIKLVDFYGDTMIRAYKKDYLDAYKVLLQYYNVAQNMLHARYSEFTVPDKHNLRVYYNNSRPAPMALDKLMLPGDLLSYNEAVEASKHTYLLMAYTLPETLLLTVPFVNGAWDYTSKVVHLDWMAQDEHYLTKQDFYGAIGYYGIMDGEPILAARHTHVRVV